MPFISRVCAFAILLGSCLLFLVEPLVAKQLVPLLGGSPAVWITCLVFFQTALLLGYLLAHWLVTSLPARAQALAYAALLAAGLLVIVYNINPEIHADTTHPVWSVFRVLTALIGLPFLLLSAAGPLLQAWYSRGFHAVSSGSVKAVPPYRLFALSNFGSLLALVAYPALIEPHYSLHEQTRGWAIGFVFFVVACAVVLWQGRHPGPEAATQEVSNESAAADDADSKSVATQYALWIMLAACGSVLLCAVTNHLNQNIVAIPLLWILPLVAYLFSFVLVFHGKFYPRQIVLGLAAVALGSIAYMLYCDINPVHWALPAKVAVPFLCSTLLVLCGFCHRGIFRVRPRRPHPTSVFLCTSSRGPIASFLVGVLAPLVFSGNYEFVYSLLLTSILGLIVTWRLGLLWRAGGGARLAF